MKPWIAASLLLLAPLASAQEIKNLRPCYGPLGATRTDTNCLLGDSLFVAYDIEGLKFDPATGNANFTTIVELFDSNNKSVFEPRKSPNVGSAQLGGTRMPAEFYVIIGRDLTPGKFTARVTVVDNLAKDFKSAVLYFNVLPKQFGFAGVTAQGIGFPGQPYTIGLALIDMQLGADKNPNVELTMKIFDDAGTLVAKPLTSKIPQDFPAGTDLKLTETNFVPFPIPIYLNRAGRFKVELVAIDHLAKKTATVNYSLNVVDIGSMGR